MASTLTDWKFPKPLIQIDIVEQIFLKNSPIGGYIVSLAKFGVTGFTKLEEFLGCKRILEEERINFEFNQKKNLIWLPVLSENLKMLFSK